MIAFNRDPKYSERAKWTDKSQPCIYCGRPIKDGANVKWIRLVNGGDSVALADETVDGQGDLGCFPIGNNCLHSHPELQPYAV